MTPDSRQTRVLFSAEKSRFKLQKYPEAPSDFLKWAEGRHLNINRRAKLATGRCSRSRDPESSENFPSSAQMSQLSLRRLLIL